MQEVQEHTISQEVERLFALQHEDNNLQRVKDMSVKQRIAKIKKIESYLLDARNQDEWLSALWKDLHKCKEEALTTELTPIITAAKHIYNNLNHWVQDEPVDAPIAMAGLSSYVKYEPKGHVMVISPWNYPLQLAVNPLIHAIAAGNVVLLKPSEIASHTSAFLKKMISDLFDEKEVAVVEGGIPETTQLLDKPFHHIFFTGSPAVGKIVMKAASKHLTSVTLELGGKSPVVVDKTISMEVAAGKVAFGKCINAGQTCIAPDYVLIHESKEDEFIHQFKLHVEGFYNQGRQGYSGISRIWKNH
jgi:aldehyde dehydrogenase (NAD+)